MKFLQQTMMFFSPGCIVLIFTFLFSDCTTSPRYTKSSSSTAQYYAQPKQNYTNQHATSHNTHSKQENQSIDQFSDNSEESFSETIQNQPKNSGPVYSENGLATYYSDKFHGRKTSSGERYDKRKFTAAHRTLPFNTMAKVTSIDNGKSVVVRINDRGPHTKNRIIDLSKAAAREIDLIHKGVTMVKIEVFEHQ